MFHAVKDIVVALALMSSLGLVYVVERSLPPVSSDEPEKPVPERPKPVAVVPVPVAVEPERKDFTTRPVPEIDSASDPAAPALERLQAVDPVPRIAVNRAARGRFGLMTTTGDPATPSDDGKRLTFSADGGTNNIRLSVDGATPTLDGFSGNFRNIEVVEETTIVAGDQSRRMDTLRVIFQLKNTGTKDHQVGLRVMIDTLIGDNDGVPFFVPGRGGIISAPRVFEGPEVPEEIRALENANLERPGVIVNIGLRAESAERPDMVCLTHWPGSDAEWNYNRSPASSLGDSAAGIYFMPKTLEAGATRRVGFTYGLGTASATGKKDARLSLTTNGELRSGSRFYLVALVQDAGPGQSIRITLPDGLTLVDPSTASQAVPEGRALTQVDWLVQIAPQAFGVREAGVTIAPKGTREALKLAIKPREAKLVLGVQGVFREREAFWVSAVVQFPAAGQSVRLELPPGLTLEPGHADRKPIELSNPQVAQVDWLVRAGKLSAGKKPLSVVLEPTGDRERAEVEVLPRVAPKSDLLTPTQN